MTDFTSSWQMHVSLWTHFFHIRCAGNIFMEVGCESHALYTKNVDLVLICNTDTCSDCEIYSPWKFESQQLTYLKLAIGKYKIENGNWKWKKENKKWKTIPLEFTMYRKRNNTTMKRRPIQCQKGNLQVYKIRFEDNSTLSCIIKVSSYII